MTIETGNPGEGENGKDKQIKRSEELLEKFFEETSLDKIQEIVNEVRAKHPEWVNEDDKTVLSNQYETDPDMFLG